VSAHAFTDPSYAYHVCPRCVVIALPFLSLFALWLLFYLITWCRVRWARRPRDVSLLRWIRGQQRAEVTKTGMFPLCQVCNIPTNLSIKKYPRGVKGYSDTCARTTTLTSSVLTPAIPGPVNPPLTPSSPHFFSWYDVDIVHPFGGTVPNRLIGQICQQFVIHCSIGQLCILA